MMPRPMPAIAEMYMGEMARPYVAVDDRPPQAGEEDWSDEDTADVESNDHDGPILLKCAM